MGYFNQFVNECAPLFSVIIEDDDKVCYAYLLKENQIVSDVWIYNCGENDTVDWDKEGDLPFANPKIFIKNNIQPFDEFTVINVKWGFDNGKV